MLVLLRHRKQSDPVRGGEFPNERLQRKIRTSQGFDEVWLSLAWVNGRERLRSFADQGHKAASLAGQAAQQAQLFARDEWHIDREHYEVRGLHLAKGFRQATEWATRWGFVQK